MQNTSFRARRTAGFFSRPLLYSCLLTLITLGSACNRAPDKNAAANSDPDQLLRQMSETLARAQKLSFNVDRKLDAALVEGRNVPEAARIEISVSRPGKFHAKSESADDVRHVFLDGQAFTIYDESMKLFAAVPASGTIDQVVAAIDEKYGFTPPLTEFILSDPYGALAPHIKSKTYKGKETLAGVECHHLTVTGDVADSELWIGAADLLPRKLIATFKNREGSPKLQADFSNWDLAPSLDDTIFVFAAPQGAEKVEMVSEAQMREAAAKAAQEKITTE